jgi:hypothetical protein
MSATILRRVGSARSSIPSAARLGMLDPRVLAVPASRRAFWNRRRQRFTGTYVVNAASPGSFRFIETIVILALGGGPYGVPVRDLP